MKIAYFSILTLLISTFSIAQKKSINEKKFVAIGGIEQWITIKGDDISQAVVLFIHGGPGSTMSQFTNSMYGEWEKDFILVNWDQRGAGRTYGRNVPSNITEEYWIDNPLTVEQMTNDGIELTEYLINYLKKKKIILIGTSWGSIIGTEMALGHPELFHAYVAHSQFVNFSENINYAYNKVYGLAENEKDIESIQKLESLGVPPYNSAKNYGQLLRVVKSYERKNSISAPSTWFNLEAEYNNKKDSKDRYDGDDYSFVHFVGHEMLNIKSMVSKIDFNKNALNFKLPVYYIQGEEDILTSKEVNKPYFDKINAPIKEYFLLKDAGHGHNKSVVDKQFEVVNKFKSSN
tara:strand:- start:3261 stop:4301 length:1041 start_codon:yes stop_codon:yes gene_type:complete